jgi:hypothetical protein
MATGSMNLRAIICHVWPIHPRMPEQHNLLLPTKFTRKITDIFEKQNESPCQYLEGCKVMRITHLTPLELSCCFAATPVPDDWQEGYCCRLYRSGACKYPADEPQMVLQCLRCWDNVIRKIRQCNSCVPLFHKQGHKNQIPGLDSYTNNGSSLPIDYDNNMLLELLTKTIETVV